MPEYGLEPLQPLKFPSWTVTRKPPFNFDQFYQNIKLWNHLLVEIKDVKVELSDTKFTLTLNTHYPEVVFSADYDYRNAIFDGVDMSSTGKCNATARSYDSSTVFNGEIRENDGLNYVVITNTTSLVISMGSLSVSYKSDNSEIGNSITEHFNNNWEAIVEGEGDKYLSIFSATYQIAANDIFSRIPYNVLFPK